MIGAAIVTALFAVGAFDAAHAQPAKRFARAQSSTSDFDRRYLEATASQPVLRCTANSSFLQGATSLNDAEVCDGRKRFSGSVNDQDHFKASVLSARAVTSEQPSKVLYKAFLKMNCIEFGMLGANYETADRNYTYIGSKVGDGIDAPAVRNRPVLMYRNGSTFLAVEPKSGDSWFSRNAEATETVSWTRLTHRR